VDHIYSRSPLTWNRSALSYRQLQWPFAVEGPAPWSTFTAKWGKISPQRAHNWQASVKCKIELAFSASPETTRREPLEFDLRHSVGKPQDLADCPLCDPNVFPEAAGFCRRVPMFFCRVEVTSRRSTAADTPPSSGLRRASPDWHSFSAFLLHKTMASSWFCLGASLAASANTCWMLNLNSAGHTF
jgi:hypothetical protein